MLRLYRTYRIFPALVAALLFLGTGLPLMGYACGVTPEAGGATVVASAEASSTNGCETPLGCQEASTEVPVEGSSAASALVTIDAGEPCCTLRAQKRSFAFTAPSFSSAPSLLPLAAVLEAKQLPKVPFYLSSFFDRGSDAIFSAPIPVRLVTSVFLL